MSYFLPKPSKTRTHNYMSPLAPLAARHALFYGNFLQFLLIIWFKGLHVVMAFRASLIYSLKLTLNHNLEA